MAFWAISTLHALNLSRGTMITKIHHIHKHIPIPVFLLKDVGPYYNVSP